MLRALRDEAAGDAIGHRERGSLLHACLAVAHEAIVPYLGSKPSDELERLALDAARAYLERRGQGALRRAGLATALADVSAVINWSLNEGSGLRFLEAERAFGKGQPWSPLAVGEHFVSGRIDRIDRSSDGKRLRVLDYKTGKPPTRPEMEQDLLQPWLYAAKVAAEHGVGEVSAGYLALRDRTPRLHPSADAAPHSELVARARERAERALSRLTSGAIEPKPSHARLCVRCDARDLCRRPLSAPLNEEDDG